MSEAIQGNNSYDSAGIPMKRKRGRPRKDKSLYREASVRPKKHENLHRIEYASVPPGIPVFKGEHVNPVDSTSSNLVGRAVTGVVESVFDAGYLIAVKVGNSNITLRGLVFKPGHYAPVTAENDVAPCLQMVKGNDIHLPTKKRRHARQPRPRERYQWSADYLGNGSYKHPMASNLLSTKDKHTAIVVASSFPSVGARGTVVPVVLEPVNAGTAQAAHMETLKGKHVQTVAPLSTYDPKGPAPHLLQSQTISHVLPKDVNSEDGPFHHGSLELHQRNGGESMDSMNICLTAEEFQGGLQPSKAQGYSSAPEQNTSDMNEPLHVEPLQTVHGNHHNQSSFAPNFLGHNGIGKMTELLQAVQENMKENQLHPERLPAFPKAKFSKQNIPGNGLGVEEVVQSQKCFQSPSV